MILRVCALYPDLMNIYADRGNLLMLERRCALARNRLASCTRAALGEPLRDEHDLYYIGGGQDADQRRCAARPRSSTRRRRCARPPRAARSCSASAAATSCSATPTSWTRETIPGIGLLDLHTVRGDGPRLIGNIARASSPRA